MGFAQFRDGGRIFQVRVGMVARAEGRVLLHRTAGDDIWSLPGGRLMVGETAAQAVVRQMREEIDAEVEPGELLWTLENFWRGTAMDDSGQAEVEHHEVGLYIGATLPAALEQSDSFPGRGGVGTERPFALEYRWFRLDELGSIDVRPAALRERLAGETVR